MSAIITKIVYFDEGSATDFVQVTNEGALDSIVQLLEEDDSQGSAGIEAKVGIRTKALRALIGLDASAETGGSYETSFKSGTVVKSIVSNTVLTDFISAVESQGEEEKAIIEISGYQIEQIPGSISSMALLTPYFSMIRSGQGIPAGDFDISLDKLDMTLSKAKGYFEFLACKQGKNSIILRFNSAAFKNNYRPSDLLKMDLCLFAVCVGSCSLHDLAVDSELNIEGFSSKDNPSYTEGDVDAAFALQVDNLCMYDVLLAGVKTVG